MKRTFGLVEAIFDIAYLVAAFIIGIVLLVTVGGTGVRALAGVMALVLAGGDSFHLVPRALSIITGDEQRFSAAMGRGKQITSITMTLYYVLLWYIGCALFNLVTSGFLTILVLVLAAVRVVLCLMPQNRWLDAKPPVSWGIIRNVPFALLGIVVAGAFAVFGAEAPAVSWMWLAILLSFGFYLPVVVGANKVPALGALMLPKTLMYVWMLVMCLGL